MCESDQCSPKDFNKKKWLLDDLSCIAKRGEGKERTENESECGLGDGI